MDINEDNDEDNYEDNDEDNYEDNDEDNYEDNDEDKNNFKLKRGVSVGISSSYDSSRFKSFAET